MNELMLLGVLGSGSACGSLAYLVLQPQREAPAAPLEEARRTTLRAQSWWYRHAPPTVAWVRYHVERSLSKQVAELRPLLRMLHEDAWHPGEYLAVRLLPLTLTLVAVAVAGTWWFGMAGIGFAVVAALAAPLLIVRGTRTRAQRRVQQVRQRLPFLLDLMALVLEAGGGSLVQCLQRGANENRGEPLGDELTHVLNQLTKNVPVPDVFQNWGQQLGDPDIIEVVNAICAAETRGNPLKENLRHVATRLRVRQAQWIEKASEEAKVHITWPTMVVMVACLLIVVAPVVIGAVTAGKL